VTRRELQAWVREQLRLPAHLERSLLQAIDGVFRRHERGFDGSRPDPVPAPGAHEFAHQIRELTERAQRDPKTKLVNFDHFRKKLVTFLKLEQRGQWCAVGLVDVHGFKRFNDTLGHLVGDRILETIARILGEQVRSHDMIAQDRAGDSRDLHARFGGDEFCFLISNLADQSQGHAVAERFRLAVAKANWLAVDSRLRPVRVDVGVVSLRLHAVAERTALASVIAEKLLERADALMYEAKRSESPGVRSTVMDLDRGMPVERT
jgi:diguanylate cyclase (GGDEF)-like protein